jgi:hypothetical protein
MEKLIVALVATVTGITTSFAVYAIGKPLKIGRWYTSHEYDACRTQKAAVIPYTLRWVDGPIMSQPWQRTRSPKATASSSSPASATG